MIDLNREMDLASDACPPSRITAAGLDWNRCWDAGGIGLVRAEVYRDGTYQPVDEGGRLLWVLPTFYGPVVPSTLTDLVAWSPDDPGRWWRRTGEAAMLGYGNAQRAQQAVWDFGDGGSIPLLCLHPDPKSYALAGFTGAVILDWQYGPAELEGIERIYCGGNLDLAERLDRALRGRQPSLPEILLDRPERQAA